MVEGRRKFLGEILQDIGLITKEKLETALTEQRRTGERLGNVLIKLGYIDSEGLYKALASQFELETINVLEYSVTQELIDKVPSAVARKHKIIPLKFENNTLTIAMASPLNLLALDNLKIILNCEIEGVLATEEDIESSIEKHYGVREETIDDMLQELSEQDVSFIGGETEEEEEVSGLSDEAPVIKLVGLLILEALRSRASDIHIEPLEEKFRVRYRVDGVLREVPAPPKRMEKAVISRIKIMSGMNIAERRLPQDGKIRLSLLGKDVDLRVSTLPALHGESMVLRILGKSSLLLGMGELGFLEEDVKKFESLIASPNGIILVTGPTGSGKTTTLYAALNKINQPDRKLITVEEPVEYQLTGINQVNVKSGIGLTFARVLRSILRQSPDIIMVGEIRDGETAEIAIRSALTGHLVFSTLHTNDAPSAVTRLIDMGIKPFLVASSIQAVLAQRLVRAICPACKEPYTPREDEVLQLEGAFKKKNIGKTQFYRGKGCPKCSQTGYKGRIGIFELLVLNSKIRALIIQRTSSAEIRKKACESGMRTLRQDGLEKVLMGVTTFSEVERVTQKDMEL